MSFKSEYLWWGHIQENVNLSADRPSVIWLSIALLCYWLNVQTSSFEKGQKILRTETVCLEKKLSFFKYIWLFYLTKCDSKAEATWQLLWTFALLMKPAFFWNRKIKLFPLKSVAAESLYTWETIHQSLCVTKVKLRWKQKLLFLSHLVLSL